MILRFLLLMLLSFSAYAEIVVDLSKCTLTWDASTGVVDSYTVFVGEDGGPASQVGTTTNTSFSCSDMQITKNGDYFARVSATNAKGESPRSAALPFTVNSVEFLEIPGEPTNLQLAQ